MDYNNSNMIFPRQTLGSQTQNTYQAQGQLNRSYAQPFPYSGNNGLWLNNSAVFYHVLSLIIQLLQQLSNQPYQQQPAHPPIQAVYGAPSVPPGDQVIQPVYGLAVTNPTRYT